MARLTRTGSVLRSVTGLWIHQSGSVLWFEPAVTGQREVQPARSQEKAL